MPRIGFLGALEVVYKFVGGWGGVADTFYLDHSAQLCWDKL